MVLQQGSITDEGIQQLRSRLGGYVRTRQYGTGPWNTEVTRDNIRHYCYGIGDDNPLWLDEEYARKTRWGGVIAPPSFLYSVYWCSGRVGGLPGVHGFHAGNDWHFIRPMMVGDRVTVQEQFSDIQVKQSEFAKRIVITYSTATYRNQRGEDIARCKGWQVRAERGAARERGKYTGIERHTYTPEELKRIEDETLSEEVRGAEPRFWQDVQVGDQMTPVVKGPLSQGDLLTFVAGTLGGLSHRMALKEFRRHPAWGFRDPHTGALEAIARVHERSEAAQGTGIPAAYDFGCQRMSWLSHAVTNWMGDDGFLKRLYGELRRFNVVGDTTWVRGKVVKKYRDETTGEHLVDLEIWAENQRKEVTAPGSATVALPARASREI